MSVHMMIAAAYLDEIRPGEPLKSSAKLVLMAYADSSDEHSLESAPGFAKVRAWSGLGRSQASAVVAQLTAAGLLTRIVEGRLGRRAVYRVFPNGVPAIPRPADVAARYATPDEPVDNSTNEGPAHRPLGSDPTPSRVRHTGPLHASTSVSTRERTGFPGARPVDDDAQGTRRRAKGAADQPCPRHHDQIVPCGRCAHVAANADPVKVAAARKLARDGIRAAATPTTEETP